MNTISDDSCNAPDRDVPRARSCRRRIGLSVFFALAILGLSVFFIQAFREVFNGPSAEQAFRRYIKDPIPGSVSNLKIKYVPHLRGYWIWLAFRIEPAELKSLFDLNQFSPPLQYSVEENNAPILPYLKPFQELDPEGADQLKNADFLESYHSDSSKSLSWRVIISRDHRRVYYCRFTD